MLLNSVVINDIKTIINTSREKAIRAEDTERVLMYWHIGQRIFLEEQEGKDRADYGKYLVKHIADSLQPEFGTGYSKRQVELFRQFYRISNCERTAFAIDLDTLQISLIAEINKEIDKTKAY